MAFDWSMTNGQSSFEQGHSGSSNANGFYGQGQASSFPLPAATAGNSMGSAGVANGNISGAGASLVSNFDSYGEPAYPHLDRRSASHTAPSLYPLYGYCSAAYAMHPFNRPAGTIIPGFAGSMPEGQLSWPAPHPWTV